MRKMGLDVGTVRIGIAFSDPIGIMASGHETYRVTGDESKDFGHISELARDMRCDGIVIGLPLNMDGTFGPKAKEIKEFADALAKYTDLPVEFQDERMTTALAERELISQSVRRRKRREVVDRTAATIILQTYLDKNREGVR